MDETMSDVIFLARHPGWTWSALQETPDDVVEALRLLDRKMGEAAPR